MSIKNTKNNFTIKKGKNKIQLQSLNVKHGNVDTRGYLFNNIAYISDCKTIPKKTLLKLKNLDFLILDCFKKAEHGTHLDFNNSINLVKYLKPKKAILTNLHVELDYNKIKKKLPKNVTPAYDGLKISF